jgi:WD40 repeat protein
LPILATGSADGTTKLWRFNPDGSAASCVNTLQERSGWIFSVAFHPILPILAIGNEDNTVKLWRLNSDGTAAECVATLQGHSGCIFSVAFHPTLPILATGSMDHTAKLWRFNPDGSAASCVTTLERQRSHVRSVAFHPSLPILATSSHDNTAKIWQLNSDCSAAECVATLQDHYNPVNSVAFYTSLPILATGCWDNNIRLWQLNAEGIAVNSAPIPDAPEDALSIRNAVFGNGKPVKIITIPREFQRELQLTSKNNSTNKKCPNFKHLYDKIMKDDIDLIGKFRFEFEGQAGSDYGGLTRDIFEKLLPVYTDKYFQRIEGEDNNNYLILKKIEDISQPQPNNFKNKKTEEIIIIIWNIFITETQKMIFLANAANTKIFLKIDPRLLDLLQSDNYMEYFNNSKKRNFKLLYKRINQFIELDDYNTLSNNTILLRKKKTINNNIIKQYKNAKALVNEAKEANEVNGANKAKAANETNKAKEANKAKAAKIKEILIKEIRLRRFVIEFGFTDWNQFDNMFLFIQNFWDIDSFTSEELKFDIESFSKRLKIKKEFPRQNEFSNHLIIEIPLDKFGKLSSDNSKFVFKDNFNGNITELFTEYSSLRPLLELILGPESNDENRKIFIKAITGSAYYQGNFYILLSSSNSNDTKRLFKPVTCFFYLELYKRSSKENNGDLKSMTNSIKVQLEHNNEFRYA